MNEISLVFTYFGFSYCCSGASTGLDGGCTGSGYQSRGRRCWNASGYWCATGWWSFHSDEISTKIVPGKSVSGVSCFFGCVIKAVVSSIAFSYVSLMIVIAFFFR